MINSEDIEILINIKKRHVNQYRKNLNLLLQKHFNNNEFFHLFEYALSKKDFDLAKKIYHLEPLRILRLAFIEKQIRRDLSLNNGSIYYNPETLLFLNDLFLKNYKKLVSLNDFYEDNILHYYYFKDCTKIRLYLDLVNRIAEKIIIPHGIFFHGINHTKDISDLIQLTQYDQHGLFTELLKKTGRVEIHFAYSIPLVDNPDITQIIDKLKVDLIVALHNDLFNVDDFLTGANNHYNNNLMICYLFALKYTNQMHLFDIANIQFFTYLINRLSIQHAQTLFALFPDFTPEDTEQFHAFVSHIISVSFNEKTNSLQHFIEKVINDRFNDLQFFENIFFQSADNKKYVPFSQYLHDKFPKNSFCYNFLIRSFQQYIILEKMKLENVSRDSVKKSFPDQIKRL